MKEIISYTELICKHSAQNSPYPHQTLEQQARKYKQKSNFSTRITFTMLSHSHTLRCHLYFRGCYLGKEKEK
ncbi:hypothetical protein TorRG33x02_045520 [Trema orientale]|uniref:Uncharacterized protein n=1 Tax=Trema orientale TaxID=63057 RepID=A0A2P5FPP1_TREOI|nr:hypothetical protein TorRG33x02_045520 [Trema orientale]